MNITNKNLAPFLLLFRPKNKFILVESQLRKREFKKSPAGKCPRGLKKLIKKANKHIGNWGDGYRWNKEESKIEFFQFIMGFDDYHKKIKEINLND